MTGRGRIQRGTARVVRVAVELAQQGAVVFEGAFTFALLDAKGAEQLLGGPLPEEWRRFAR